ncbi:MAG: hypothetical protein AAF219_04140 [Myxococcota bacterium]
MRLRRLHFFTVPLLIGLGSGCDNGQVAGPWELAGQELSSSRSIEIDPGQRIQAEASPLILAPMELRKQREAEEGSYLFTNSGDVAYAFYKLSNTTSQFSVFVRARSPNSNAAIRVVIDQSTRLEVPVANDWAEIPAGEVELNAGDHLLALESVSGNVWIDAIQFDPGSVPDTGFPVRFELVAPVSSTLVDGDLEDGIDPVEQAIVDEGIAIAGYVRPGRSVSSPVSLRFTGPGVDISKDDSLEPYSVFDEEDEQLRPEIVASGEYTLIAIVGDAELRVPLTLGSTPATPPNPPNPPPGGDDNIDYIDPSVLGESCWSI